jgi:hypothetical protein
MSGFWRAWFMSWCLSIGVFGIVLAGGAFEATSGPVSLLFSWLQGPSEIVWNAPMRFSLGVMGGVSIGWAVMLTLVVRAAIAAGEVGRPLWNAVSAGMAAWFVIDGILSVATGFAMNVAPNTLLAGMYLVGLFGSGALRRAA